MKKLILIFTLIAIFAVGSAQDGFKGFFKPVSADLLKTNVKGSKAILNPSVWVFRPAINITAVQLNWNKETKQFDASAFNQAGLGVSYAHFVEANGLPYNNFSFNALFLLGADIQNGTPATMSAALTGSFLNFVNLGGLYNFTNKNFGILTGIALKF